MFDPNLYEKYPINGYRQNYDAKQKEIEFFWPLLEQIPLDLNYEGCNTRENNGLTISGGTGLTIINNGQTWVTNTITPSLSINPTNAVGEFSLGSLNIGMERKPNLLRRIVYKILGFDWKDK